MKNLRKILALVLVLAMALSVVACSSKPAESTPSEPTTESTPAEKPAEPEKEAEPYTITISVQASTGAEEGWKAVAEGYKQYHPEANIIVDLKAGEGYSEWIKTIASDYKTNTVDIMNINLVPDRTNDMVINWEEYMEEVNPYDAEGRIWKDCFNYNAQTRSTVDNTMDSLSLDSVQVTWFYNKDIFAEVGVEPPKTWDEMVEVCEKIDAAGYQPICLEGGYDSFYSGRMGWLTQIYADQTTRTNVELIRAKEGDYCYDPDVDGKFVLDLTNPWNDDLVNLNINPVRFWAAIQDGEIGANTPGTVAVWDNFKKVFPKYAGGDAFFGTIDGMPLFYQGKAAIYADVSGFAVAFANTMKKAAAGEAITKGDEVIEGVKPFELGMFNMPSMTNESGKYGADEIFQAPARTVEVAVGFLGSFSRNAEQDAHIVDFMMYYSSAEGMTKFVNAALPADWTPAGASLVYGVTYPEEIQSAFENIEWIGNCQKGSKGQAFARGLVDNQESTRKYYDLAQQCLSGKITSEEYAEGMGKQHLEYFETCLPKTIALSDLEHPEIEPVGQTDAK